MNLVKNSVIVILLVGGVAMASDYDQTEVYSGLRSQILTITADQIETQSPVLAVLMETGYPEAVVTLVAVADGSSSLYFSNGGGIIGAGEYKQVHQSSIDLVKITAKYHDKFSPTEKYPLPEIGYTRFYVVTTSGVLTAEVLEDDLGNEKHDLSPVFFQGHQLIAYIRAAEEHRSANQGASDER